MENLKEYIRKLSHDFSKQTLDESEVNKDPLMQFENWFREAVKANVASPNAMVVSTASKKGRPSARVLLLRNFDEKGFVFYTNYQSRKAADLDQNPFAAITFFWTELERQIRIEGTIEKQSGKESDEYFSMRPDGSKLGAWSSPQSSVVEGRIVLEERYNKMKEKYEGSVIPRPSFWGGYILKPEMFEFWQGRPSRMHDRIVYHLNEENIWTIERIAP